VSHNFPRTSAFLLVSLALFSSGAGPVSVQRRSEQTAVNPCGCFEEEPGVCKCLRKSKCGCPGECEPLGCEEKRQKDLSRRMEQELKKIREDDLARAKRKPDQDHKKPDNEADGSQDANEGSQHP
jgi:hypothetical protein